MDNEMETKKLLQEIVDGLENVDTTLDLIFDFLLKGAKIENDKKED